MTGRFPTYEPPSEPEPERSEFPLYDAGPEQPESPAGQVPARRPKRPTRPSRPKRPGPRARAAVPSPAKGLRGLAIGAVAVVVLVIGGGVAVHTLTAPEEVPSPTGTITADGDSIKQQLEARRDRYLTARKEGRLASVGLRDDDPFDDTAVLAYTFFLTDMIIASNFGVDDDDAERYARRAAAFERRLLAHEPLGEDIDIKFSKDREFVYDGQTGKGGYQDPPD